MAVIKSGNSTDQLSVDTASKAARVTVYDTQGNAVVSNGVLLISGHVTVDSLPQSGGTVAVSNFPITQAVSGTVTANISNTNGIALDTTLTDGTQKTQVTNFPGISTVTGNVGIPSGVNINNFPATQPVSGSVSVSNFPASQTVLVSNPVTSLVVTNFPASQAVTVGNFPANQQVNGTINAIIASGIYVQNLTQVGGASITLGEKAMAASLPVVIASDQDPVAVSGSVAVSNFPAVQAVSGTVTANLGTVDGLALDATLTSGGQKTQVTNFPATQTITGTVTNTPVDGVRATYSASVIGLVAPNTATDLFTITGSATKTIRITRLTITATQTTSAQVNFVLLKRSTANTAGTSTTPAIVPHDSSSAAATAVVRAYTANPTLGTLVGNIKTRKVFVGATTANSDECIWEFGARPAQALVLRGVNEVLALNLNGVTVTASSFNISIEFTEE